MNKIIFIFILSNLINSRSWVEYSKFSQFPIENIPFGVCFFKKLNLERCCSIIGDYIIDLSYLESKGLLDNKNYTFNTKSSIFNQNNLNDFLTLGKEVWKSVRERLINIFSKNSNTIGLAMNSLYHKDYIEMRMPIKVSEFTDFYSSKNHAYNMGSLIRGPQNAIQPNWYSMPIAYHGRSSTIVVDGTDIQRPKGQIKEQEMENSNYSETKKLDFEAEIGIIIGKSNKIFEPIKVEDANDYIFGLVLLNDWSARDIQTYEYVPLGPFTSKNFATTISPWIITLEALRPFEINLPNNTMNIDYLKDKTMKHWDIPINIYIKDKNLKESIISITNYKYMYWSTSQQIAHHSITGCKLNIGDILGSGTLSGIEENTYGSLFEINKAGKKIIKINGSERLWIEDNDTIRLEAILNGDGYYIGFGNCSGKVIPNIKD